MAVLEVVVGVTFAFDDVGDVEALHLQEEFIGWYLAHLVSGLHRVRLLREAYALRRSPRMTRFCPVSLIQPKNAIYPQRKRGSRAQSITAINKI